MNFFIGKGAVSDLKLKRPAIERHRDDGTAPLFRLDVIRYIKQRFRPAGLNDEARVRPPELKATLQNALVPPDVTTAIAHYIQLVERKIVASQALIDACKSIYKQHRTAVDLVVQYGQEPQLSQAFEQFVSESGQSLSLQTTAVRSNTVFFLFGDWLQIPNYPPADRKRWSSVFPVQLWFQVGAKRLYLRLSVGPLTKTDKRPALVQVLQSQLKPRASGNGKGSIFTCVVTFSTSISEDPEVGELVVAMEKVWKDANPQHLKEVVYKHVADLAQP